MCKIPCTVKLKLESSENGDVIFTAQYKKLCNYQECAVTHLTSIKTEVTVTGKAYFIGDICTAIAVISGGTIEIFGGTREIFRGFKARNPDGTVNYTLIEVV